MEDKKESFIIFMQDFPRYYIDQLKNFSKPDVCNGSVNINKWKITVETIGESKKDTISRLKYLYLDEDNWHNKQAIDDYCKRKWGFRMYDLVKKEKSQTQADSAESVS